MVARDFRFRRHQSRAEFKVRIQLAYYRELPTLQPATKTATSLRSPRARDAFVGLNSKVAEEKRTPNHNCRAGRANWRPFSQSRVGRLGSSVGLRAKLNHWTICLTRALARNCSALFGSLVEPPFRARDNLSYFGHSALLQLSDYEISPRLACCCRRRLTRLSMGALSACFRI